jgi:hypothetical protein
MVLKCFILIIAFWPLAFSVIADLNPRSILNSHRGHGGEKALALRQTRFQYPFETRLPLNFKFKMSNFKFPQAVVPGAKKSHIASLSVNTLNH